LRSKSFIIFILFLFVIITLIYYLSLFFFYMPKLRKDNINITINDLKNFTELIKYHITNELYNNNYQKLDSYLKDVSKNMNIRVTLIDINGKVISDSYENPEFMDTHINRPEVIDALKNNKGISIRHSNTLNKEMLYIAEKLTYNNTNVGILRISIFLDSIDIIVNKNIFNIVIFSLFIFFVSIILIFVIYYRFKKKFKILYDLSKNVVNGNFDIKFDAGSDYESEQLAKSFDNMMIKLKEIFKELIDEKEELQNILSSIKEGISVLNSQGIILSCNKSFKKMVRNDNPEGRYYWEVIRSKDFEDILEHNGKHIKTINIYDLELIVSISKTESIDKTIIVFYDITESIKLEKIKKEFITNASHELNTPLTSIMGYIETLLDEEKDKERIKYYNIIQKQTKRLINIVQDLLKLSQLDEKRNLEFKKVNLEQIIENILPIFKKKANEKSLKLKVKIEKEIFLNGDEDKLEQMFINLIDNSIKYTNKGEIEVVINKSEDRLVKISIEDTGIGIPEEHLPYIFERFYIVDKSRTKENGGTGLGLSIVKSIVDLHKGKINVESKENKGTKFIIYLPEY